MNVSETIVIFGGPVKALGDGKIGGYLVRFSTANDPDLEGEFFTKETDFGEADASPVYYQHGMDPRLGKRKLGRAKHKKDDFGVWAEAQLNLRDEYEGFIYQMAKQGKMGWSSGTAGHLIERESYGKAAWLKTWPLGLDATLTPTPAEPRAEAIPLKSWKPAEATFTLTERMNLLADEIKGITSDLRGLLEQQRPLNEVKRTELARILEMFSGLDDVRHELDEVLNNAPPSRLAATRLVSRQLAEARKRLTAKNILQE